MSNTIRLPIVSGTFYPNQPDRLRQLLNTLLGNDAALPGRSLPSSLGLVLPHAGYIYSGSVAAAGYLEAARFGRPDVVVILGASHTGVGPWFALAPHSHWQTPLGRSPVDLDMIAQLRGEGFTTEAASFEREHSIEVQLPFIQYLWGVAPTIVPVCVAPAPLAGVYEAARALSKLLEDRHALLIASSDFTHFEADSRARAADAAAMNRILALDVPGFHSLCREQQLTICGATSIEVLMATASNSHWSATRIVDYTTSADVTGDRSSVVGYACLAMTKENYG
ncbi:AmmeMemoRadiSam system protein B [Candidatus Bipolaricaulota bacterium]|nr:AmmeMemoRadiSam system protein B [Candidatus Bipolaricaulota bacterium]